MRYIQMAYTMSSQERINTTTVDKTRKKYSPTILSSIPKSKFKTVLKDYTFEAKMMSSTTSTDDIFLFLSSIRHTMDEITNEVQNDMSVQCAMAGAEWPVRATVEDDTTHVDRTTAPLDVVRDEVNGDSQAWLAMETRNDLVRMMDDDANRLSAGELDEPTTPKYDVEKTKKLRYNRFMIESVWKVRRQRIKKDNVKQKQLDAVARADRKLLIKRAVLDMSNEKSDSVIIKEEKAVSISLWTKYLMNRFLEEYC